MQSFELFWRAKPQACVALTITLLACAACEADTTDRASKTKWADPALKAAYVREHRAKSPILENASASIQAAVQAYADAFCRADRLPADRSFSGREHREMLWVHLPAADKPGAVNNPDSYYETVETLGRLAFPRLQAEFAKGCVTIIRVSRRRPPEVYGPFTLHYPGEVEYRRADGSTGRTELVRTVAEVNGRYKLAQIGPG